MRRALVGLLLLAPLALAAPAPPPAPWWERTAMDADHDHLDDALAPLLHGDAPLAVLVDYALAPTADDRAALAARGCEVVYAPRNFPLLAARCAPALVRGLPALPGVVLVEEDQELRLALKDSVPLIGAPQAWRDYGATGKGIVVAVLDDGAFEQHPDLQGKVAGDFDAGAPSTPFGDPVRTVAPAGTEGHATHVAGTIVGPGTQSGGVYRGVAPDATFVNVKVFATDGSTTSDLVLRGLDWTLDNMRALHIRVVTLSLGGKPSDGTDALSRGVDVAVDKGLVVVAAAGNGGPGARTVSTPGAAAKAITVGAVDKQKRTADFSARGPTLDGRAKPDLVAPGVEITSTIPPGNATIANLLGMRSADAVYYGPLSGTSMAAPHVAGVAALMLEANPTLSPFDVKRILLVTAQDLGAPGADDETGFGFVNAIAAVQVAKDPSLLDLPEFRSRLAEVPNPPSESLLDRLSFEAGALERAGVLPYAAAGALLLAAGIAAVVVAARRR